MIRLLHVTQQQEQLYTLKPQPWRPYLNTNLAASHAQDQARSLAEIVGHRTSERFRVQDAVGIVQVGQRVC